MNALSPEGQPMKSDMVNPILIVEHAGYGTTPADPTAIYKAGDVVKVARRKTLSDFPRELVVIGIVPPHFPTEYALADLLKEARPLMITKPRRVTRYILAREGDPVAYITDAIGLHPSGKPSVEIGTIQRESAVVEPAVNTEGDI
jgi:hypothetical protein